jgi:hypothetical protein
VHPFGRLETEMQVPRKPVTDALLTLLSNGFLEWFSEEDEPGSTSPPLEIKAEEDKEGSSTNPSYQRTTATKVKNGDSEIRTKANT